MVSSQRFVHMRQYITGHPVRFHTQASRAQILYIYSGSPSFLRIWDVESAQALMKEACSLNNLV